MMKNKKAIEPVVATVLLIVITIVAVALIVAFVVPFVQKQMAGAQLCYNAKLEIKADESCYNKTSGDTIIKVSRGSEEFELAGLIIKLSNATTTKTVTFKTPIPKAPFEEQIYTIPVTQGTNNTLSVAVAPIVKTGAVEKICDITSQISISSCA